MALDESADELAVHLRRESTAEQVAAALGGLIVAGEIAPGTRLREGALSATLGVSRNTLREATHILVSQGLVRREIHRGAYVTELDDEDIRDLYRVRRLVEAAAVRELADGGGDLAGLRDAVQVLSVAVDSGDVRRALDADLRCHEILVELVGSHRLGGLFDGVDAEMRLAVALAGDARVNPRRLLKDHRAILSAIGRGRVDSALEVLARHLDAGEARLLEDLVARPAPA